MTIVTAQPVRQFCGLRIFAAREGFHVTGRVEFPYQVNGRTQCPIDYKSRRPDGSGDGSASASADIRHAQRLDLVKRWRRLCAQDPHANRRSLGERAIAESGIDRAISYRTLQRWARKLELEGPAGLRDRYVKPPGRVLTLEAGQAADAVLICAWWSFRIGNVDVIDNKMMSAAASLLDIGYPVADLLATVDCYYAWPCDRRRYPFKPFGRWIKYDFQTWLFRACDQNDYRRGLDAVRRERVALLAPETIMTPRVADPAMRRREVGHRTTRRAIRNLAAPAETPPRTPSKAVLKPVQSAALLRHIGCYDAARRVIQQAAPGIPALAVTDDPQTLAEALGTLEDSYRRMLLDAARGDPHARAQALATMPLWWDAVPRRIRSNIDFRVDAWRREHSGATDRQIAGRKLAMLLPHIRDHRHGTQRIAVALRI